MPMYHGEMLGSSSHHFNTCIDIPQQIVSFKNMPRELDFAYL